MLLLRDVTAGKRCLDENLQEHLPQVLAHHGILGERVQCFFKIEIRLFSLVEQPDRPLSFVTRDLHPVHQRFDHPDLVLGYRPVCLAEVTKRCEQGIEKRLLRRPHTNDAGEEAVDHMAQQCSDQSAADPAPEQAENSTDDLAPPVAWDVE